MFFLNSGSLPLIFLNFFYSSITFVLIKYVTLKSSLDFSNA